MSKIILESATKKELQVLINQTAFFNGGTGLWFPKQMYDILVENGITGEFCCCSVDKAKKCE